MSAPNPACKYSDNGGATFQSAPGPFTATPNNASAVIALDNSAGAAFWSLTCIGTDENSSAATVNASISINMGTKQATLTTSGKPSSLTMQSQVGILGPGLNAAGLSDPTLTTTFQINVPTTNGKCVMAAGEQQQFSPEFGWVPKVNAGIAGAGGSSPNIVNFLAYGADPTGTSTSANDAAWTAALAVPGIAGIYAPAGTYKFSSTAVAPAGSFVVIGDGSGRTGTIFQAVSGQTMLDCATNSPSVRVYGISFASGAESILESTYGLHCGGPSAIVENVYANGFDTGIKTSDANSAKLFNCSADGCNGGILLGTNTTAINCFGAAQSSPGITVNGTSSGGDVSGTTLIGCAGGWVPRTTQSAEAFRMVSAVGVSFQSCDAYRNSAAGVAVTFDSNSSMCDWGVSNFTYSTTTAGVITDANGSNVSRKVGASVASASTIAVTSFITEITGTTPITAITASASMLAPGLSFEITLICDSLNTVYGVAVPAHGALKLVWFPASSIFCPVV